MQTKPRPVIFLYTEAAQVSDDVRAAMIDAGYLPVKVAELDKVKILTAPLSVEAPDVVTVAALEALLKSDGTTNTWSADFGMRLAKAILASEKQR